MVNWFSNILYPGPSHQSLLKASRPCLGARLPWARTVLLGGSLPLELSLRHCDVAVNLANGFPRSIVAAAQARVSSGANESALQSCCGSNAQHVTVYTKFCNLGRYLAGKHNNNPAEYIPRYTWNPARDNHQGTP